MDVAEFHRVFEGGVRWRVLPAGVEIEGSGIERSKGSPVTVTRIWDSFAAQINATARARRVPCALIVATIATESGGRPDAVRLEPGYRSDDETPHKVSPGLMQTLISTAREALQLSCGRSWLLEPANSIEAGTAYIARQARLTELDPPLVAAAYNAGRLAEQTAAANRWRLRQYPIGTSAHCDRFVRFFNDAVAVFSTHRVKPAVEHVVTGGSPPARPSTKPAGTPTVAFGTSANPDGLTPYSREVLVDVLRRAKLERAVVSSTTRSPEEQARVMFANAERYGAAHAHRLYGAAGDKVIDTYERAKAAGRTPAAVQLAMADTIRTIGPEKVSRHAGDPRVLCVFDVAPSSVADRAAFEREVKAEPRVAKFLVPPADPGYHLEIPQPR